jgi:tRNA A37 methylthiotransferase MiaB
MMQKYGIYRPGEGWLLGEFADKGMAEITAAALDRNMYRSKKAYERARIAKMLHQVREVSDGQKTS